MGVPDGDWFNRRHSAGCPLRQGLLRRLGDELIGNPPRDVGGVGLCRQAEGDVPEAGVERFADRVPGGAGLVV